MTGTSPLPNAFGALPVRQGHFLLESGLHARTWIDLDTLFIDPRALAPQVQALAALLAPHGVTAACGPLLGGAFVAQAVAQCLGVRFYVAERLNAVGAAGLFAAQYRLPGTQRLLAPRETFAIVDDVISAGSSVRAVADDLATLGARTAVVGALLLLGPRAAIHFAASGVPVVAPASQAFEAWTPQECPHCRAGVALTLPAG